MWLVGGMPHRLGRDHTQTARLKTGQTGCTLCCFFPLLAIFGFQFSVSAGICLALAHMINPRTWRGHVVEKRRSNGSPKRPGQDAADELPFSQHGPGPGPGCHGARKRSGNRFAGAGSRP